MILTHLSLPLQYFDELKKTFNGYRFFNQAEKTLFCTNQVMQAIYVSNFFDYHLFYWIRNYNVIQNSLYHLNLIQVKQSFNWMNSHLNGRKTMSSLLTNVEIPFSITNIYLEPLKYPELEVIFKNSYFNYFLN